MSVLESTGPVKFAAFDLSSDGNIVAAVAGKKIRLLGGVFIGGGSGGTFTLEGKPAAGNATTLMPAMVLGNNVAQVLPVTGVGYLETRQSEALYANLSAGAVKGMVAYQLVTDHSTTAAPTTTTAAPTTTTAGG